MRKGGRSTATLWAQDGRIYIRTDYQEDFVKEFKLLIPAKHRTWKPKPEKVWTCDPSYLEEMHSLCQRYFDDVSVLESGAGEGAESVDGTDPYRLLLKHCPDDYLKKIHKAVIGVVHPDKGGTQQAAADVNRAWKVIREERGL